MWHVGAFAAPLRRPGGGNCQLAQSPIGDCVLGIAYCVLGIAYWVLRIGYCVKRNTALTGMAALKALPRSAELTSKLLPKSAGEQ